VFGGFTFGALAQNCARAVLIDSRLHPLPGFIYEFGQGYDCAYFAARRASFAAFAFSKLRSDAAIFAGVFAFPPRAEISRCESCGCCRTPAAAMNPPAWVDLRLQGR
jgi:hypothetical protein